MAGPATRGLDTFRARVSHEPMESRLAIDARRSLQDDVRRMTAEERLAAFLAHCQLIAQLAKAGDVSRHAARPLVSPNAR